MYPRAIPLLLVFVLSAVCYATDDDALSRLVVGQWQGGRHAEEYFADGTWRFLPGEGSTHGTWRIQDGRFIKSWSGGDSVAYDIVRLDAAHFVTRGADGTIFKHERIVGPRPPHDATA